MCLGFSFSCLGFSFSSFGFSFSSFGACQRELPSPFAGGDAKGELETVGRREHPSHVQNQRWSAGTANFPLDECAVHAVPEAEFGAALALRIEAHELCDAHLSVALQLGTPKPRSAIIIADDLDSNFWGAALPGLPRADGIGAGREANVNVRR